MKYKYPNIVFLIIILFMFAALNSSLSTKKRYKFIGSKTCAVCHNDESTLNQYIIWLGSPHSKAYKTLKTKKAKKIAGNYGIKNPSGHKKCLACHTTGQGKVKVTKKEGVGCEACHGPGEMYSSYSRHVNLRDKKNGYNTAKKYGMYPILDYEDSLLKREKLCLYCHSNKRPCMPTRVKDIKKQRMTIQVIDELVKGDVKFHHGIRRY